MSRRDWQSDRRITGVLDAADLLHLAVAAADGPHVTPVAFDVEGRRIWFVTPRRSLKARTISRRRRVGGLVKVGDRSVLLGGRARIVDPLTVRGVSSLGRLLDLPFAAAGYLGRNHRHATGTIRDHPAPTLALSRLAITLDITRAALLEGSELAGAWGRWEEADQLPDGLPPGSHRPDLSAVPPRIRGLLDDGAAVVVGWPSPSGPVAFPGRWRGDGVAEIPAAALGLAGAGAGPVTACVTAERSRYRLASKRGILLTGDARAGRRDATAEVALYPRRVTWWVGEDRHRVTLNPS